MDVDAAPALAGRYEIGPLIGRGGMAEVHRGFDRNLMRAVAIKCFRPEAWSTARARSRFEAEARLSAAVSHPNVVSVFDAGNQHFEYINCHPKTGVMRAV